MTGGFSRRRRAPGGGGLLRLLALSAWAAAAAPAPSQVAPDGVVRLSPAEREAAIAAAGERDERGLPINGLSRGIHGEVGAAVSSNGGHAVYGSTVVPLGQTGSAAFSFEQGSSGHWHPR